MGMKKVSVKNFDPKYLRAAVYGANDGIVTTFAVVAGVTGAQLSANIILVMGLANLAADGLAMGLGDYIGERSEQEMASRKTRTPLTKGIWKTGAITFISFVIAGGMPLLPYWLTALDVIDLQHVLFRSAIVSTAATLFVIGATRSFFTLRSWWRSGLEMLIIGTLAASVAYILGSLIHTQI